MNALRVLYVSTLLLSGCSAYRIGADLDPTKVALIKRGVTTKQQLYDTVGAPDMLKHIPGGQVWLYYDYFACYTLMAKPGPAHFVLQHRYVLDGFIPYTIRNRILWSTETKMARELRVLLLGDVVQGYRYDFVVPKADGGDESGSISDFGDSEKTTLSGPSTLSL